MSTQDNQSAGPESGQSIAPLVNPSPLVSGGKPARNEAGIVNEARATEPVSKEIEVRLKYSEEVHQYIREYIRLADQKAAFFFAVSSALLAYINGKGKLTAWLLCPSDWGWPESFAFLSVAFLLASLVACLLVVIPRLSGAAKGVIFFNAVASHATQQEYVANVASLSPASLCEEKLKHAYDISKVCRRKYQALFYAIWCGAFGVVSTALLLLGA